MSHHTRRSRDGANQHSQQQLAAAQAHQQQSVVNTHSVINNNLNRIVFHHQMGDMVTPVGFVVQQSSYQSCHPYGVQNYNNLSVYVGGSWSNFQAEGVRPPNAPMNSGRPASAFFDNSTPPSPANVSLRRGTAGSGQSSHTTRLPDSPSPPASRMTHTNRRASTSDRVPQHMRTATVAPSQPSSGDRIPRHMREAMVVQSQRSSSGVRIPRHMREAMIARSQHSSSGHTSSQEPGAPSIPPSDS